MPPTTTQSGPSAAFACATVAVGVKPMSASDWGRSTTNIGVQREVVLGDRRVEQVGDRVGGRACRVTLEGAADDDRGAPDVAVQA